MAGTFKNTYTTPETQANVTYDKLLSFEVNVETGRCSCRFAKCDSSNNILSRRSEEFTLSGSDLTTPTNSVFASAKTAGVTPAGTISEV